VFVPISYLHANSIRAFDESEFHRYVGYVGKRSRCLMMSQTVGKFVTALTVTGFDACLDETIGCNIEGAEPVLAVPVVDVPTVGIDEIPKTDFVIAVETNSFRRFGNLSRGRVRRNDEI
jgi:hypothetical protein